MEENSSARVEDSSGTTFPVQNRISWL